MADNIVGKPIDRKDGPLKVTGSATYAGEFKLKNIAYGVTVQSTITKGSIENIDTSAAEALKGVIGVMTYKNALKLQPFIGSNSGGGKFSEKELLPLQSEKVFYNGQHIAVVIAETFEIAVHAAALIKVVYQEDKAIYNLSQPEALKYTPGAAATVPKQRGDATTFTYNAFKPELAKRTIIKAFQNITG